MVIVSDGVGEIGRMWRRCSGVDEGREDERRLGRGFIGRGGGWGRGFVGRGGRSGVVRKVGGLVEEEMMEWFMCGTLLPCIIDINGRSSHEGQKNNAASEIDQSTVSNLRFVHAQSFVNSIRYSGWR